MEAVAGTRYCCTLSPAPDACFGGAIASELGLTREYHYETALTMTGNFPYHTSHAFGSVTSSHMK